jgi:hypothetical protein
MQRMKFQALVTPSPDEQARAKLGPGSHRMVLRAESAETHRTQVFSALVDGEDDGPFRPGKRKPQVMVTLRVVGDDVSDYLGIGSHFSLWLGADVGEGVVTRRLHV